MTTSLPIIQSEIPPDVIDLGLGNPPLSLLPLDIIHRAADRSLSKGDPSSLQYGLEQGDGYFRQALSEFLTNGYGCPTNPENLFVTNGISNALDLICTSFTQPDDVIFVEDPTYFLALRIFADHNLQIIPIETDEAGLIVASLEEKLAGSHPKFLYLIPTFQNPTGHTLPQERRDRIAKLSKEHDFLVVADEVYHFLNYTQKPPKPLAASTDNENIISLGSFSKILAPGLRLGWMQAHPEKIECFVISGLLDSGGGLNPFTSAIMRWVIESGDLEKNINRLVDVYRSRVAATDSALHHHLPYAKYTVPHGGYFFWIRLPEEMDGSELRKKAANYKVDFRQGALFSSTGKMRNYIRLCYVAYEPEQIEEGIVRLKQCLESR
jgi:2-aminoadipate transaminase